MNRNAPSGLALPNLRAWRLRAALSQEELAERTGISNISIGNMEKGQIVRFANIGKLADALGITRQQLVHSLPESNAVSA